VQLLRVHVIDYTEHCVEHSADDVESAEIEEEGKDLEPVEEVDLGQNPNNVHCLYQWPKKVKMLSFLRGMESFQKQV
jgi:hypothetical protein